MQVNINISPTWMRRRAMGTVGPLSLWARSETIGTTALLAMLARRWTRDRYGRRTPRSTRAAEEVLPQVRRQHFPSQPSSVWQR
jgi:hypothetical protein